MASEARERAEWAETYHRAAEEMAECLSRDEFSAAAGWFAIAEQAHDRAFGSKGEPERLSWRNIGE